MSTLAEIAGEKPGKRGYKTLAVLLAGMALPLGIYGTARATGERTPIRVPAVARQFPTPLPSQDAFLMPRSEVSNVNCGGLNTYLGGFYDDSSYRIKDVTTVTGFEAEVAVSNHRLPPSAQAELGRLSTEVIVSCQASPTIIRKP